MTQYADKVRARNQELVDEAYYNSVSGIEIVINKPENIEHINTYYNNGKVVQSYKDKRKKDQIINEAWVKI
tara:strand:+ start:83 stop:295 length:213 start_codon:yes stop_codon:yes gene_type:complete